MVTNLDNHFVRHRGPVTGVAGIPNSRRVVTSAYDGAVGLFDLESRQAELLGYHDHLVNQITVNRAGTKAASSSSDYTVCIWDLKTGQAERVLRGHWDDAEGFAFVDDSVGASVSRDWRVLVWDLQNGSIKRIIEGHQKDVLSVNYHDGKLFTSGDDMTLRVWDLKTGKLLKMWGPFETETDTCAMDAIHGHVVLGCDDGFVRVFDVDTGETLAEIKAHSSGIKKVAVSPVNGDILSAAYDQKILIWDAKDFRQKVSLENKPALWERSFNWSPDGASILAGTFDGTVVEWDAASGKCLTEAGDQETIKGNACFNDVSADSHGQIALVSDDGYIRLGRITPSDAQWSAQIEPGSGRMLMNAVTLDEEYNVVIGGAHNQVLHIYDRADGNLQNEVETFLGEGPINCVRVAHQPGFEGVSFVACYSGAIVRVTRDGKIRDKFRVHENAVKALRLHPHKPIGVSCSADGILVSWDFSGKVLNHFLGHMAIIDDVDIDPTGKYIASTGRDFSLKVYGLEDGRLLHTVSLGRRSPKALCFLTETTVIVTTYWGELIRVDLPDEKVLHRQIARNGISSIARSGDHLVVTSYDGAVYLVQPDDLTVVQTLRGMVQRVDGKWWGEL